MSKIILDVGNSWGLGDCIQWTTLPEIFYKFFNLKLTDVRKCWAFDNNPYVLREQEIPNIVSKIESKLKEPIPSIYCKIEDWPKSFQIPKNAEIIDGIVFIQLHVHTPQSEGKYCFRSKFDSISALIGISIDQKNDLKVSRNQRLYKYENEKMTPNQVVVHVGPSNSTPEQFISDDIINTIAENYKDFNIIQIGAEKDNDTPFLDKRGLDIWDSAQLIAQSFIFIGPNSGPSHLANCYPRVNKKIILCSQMINHETSRYEELKSFITSNTWMFGASDFERWIDYGCQYYNDREYDVGVTYSYKKI